MKSRMKWKDRMVGDNCLQCKGSGVAPENEISASRGVFFAVVFAVALAIVVATSSVLSAFGFDIYEMYICLLRNVSGFFIW